MTATAATEMQAAGLAWRRAALDASGASAAAGIVSAHLDRDGSKLGHRSSVARYGYDYTHEASWLRDIPEPFLDLARRLDLDSNSVTLNRYEARDYLDAHIDLDCFDMVSVLNLGATCNFTLYPPGEPSTILALGIGDCITMTDEVLRTWKHSVWSTYLRYSVVFRRRQPAQ